MEDFEGAHVQRGLDTAALDNAGRRVGAMHLGGMTIECLLKHMIVRYHRISEWDTESKRQPGVIVTQPSHDVVAASQQMALLWDRIDRDPTVRGWLEEIRYPGRLMNPEESRRLWITFVNARYDSRTPTDRAYVRWRIAYTELRKWLLDMLRTL